VIFKSNFHIAYFMPIGFRLMTGVVVVEFFFGGINTGLPSNSCSPPNSDSRLHWPGTNQTGGHSVSDNLPLNTNINDHYNLSIAFDKGGECTVPLEKFSDKRQNTPKKYATF